jgi:hypothetical protein
LSSAGAYQIVGRNQPACRHPGRDIARQGLRVVDRGCFGLVVFRNIGGLKVIVELCAFDRQPQPAKKIAARAA